MNKIIYPNLFEIIHQNPDGITSSIFKAETKELALEKYNNMANSEKYSKYPYCWRPVKIDSVYALEIYD